MTAFYFTLIAVLLAGLGARDQATVAMLTQQLGQRVTLLLVGVLLCFATAAFAAWASTLIAPLLLPRARLFFAALALGFAGIESLLLAPTRKPLEPTHSLGAATLVLLAHQLTDAARFLIFAIAVATKAPLPAGIGGALGGATIIAAGWFLPALCLHPHMLLVRRAIGVLLLAVAIFAGLTAMRII